MKKDTATEYYIRERLAHIVNGVCWLLFMFLLKNIHCAEYFMHMKWKNVFSRHFINTIFDMTRSYTHRVQAKFPANKTVRLFSFLLNTDLLKNVYNIAFNPVFHNYCNNASQRNMWRVVVVVGRIVVVWRALLTCLHQILYNTDT